MRNMFFARDIVQLISVFALGLRRGGYLDVPYIRWSQHENLAAGGVRVTWTEEEGTRI
jgi:hypothetical protein